VSQLQQSRMFPLAAVIRSPRPRAAGNDSEAVGPMHSRLEIGSPGWNSVANWDQVVPIQPELRWYWGGAAPYVQFWRASLATVMPQNAARW
jgi:hypothetical protein